MSRRDEMGDWKQKTTPEMGAKERRAVESRGGSRRRDAMPGQKTTLRLEWLRLRGMS